MPKANLNPMFTEIHGTMSDVVFHTAKKGQVIIQSPPDMSKIEWREARLIQLERMKQADEYARAAMEDPQVCAIYEEMATQEDKRPDRMAFCDYLRGNDLLSSGWNKKLS